MISQHAALPLAFGEKIPCPVQSRRYFVILPVHQARTAVLGAFRGLQATENVWEAAFLKYERLELVMIPPILHSVEVRPWACAKYSDLQQ
jgi:hypothetical protein